MRVSLVSRPIAVAATCFCIIVQCAEPAARAADNQLRPDEKEAGWILLFDGKTTEGWMTSDQKPSRRPVENGCLNPHKSGHYMLVHTQKWSSFKLALDFEMSKDCNSGVFVRTHSLTPREGKDVGYNGIEVQILDSPQAGFTDTGAIYDLSKPTKQAVKPAGEWNHMEVTCEGSKISVMLNGENVNHADLAKFTQAGKRPDGTPHKFDIAWSDHPQSGYIGLQDHGAECWFKNIKLLPLK